MCVHGSAHLYYHGRRGRPVFQEGVPAFFTADRRGAEWYAQERGDRNAQPAVYAATLRIQNPANDNELRQVVECAGATVEDVMAHSPYEGDNLHDFLYVPRVREGLEARGFDGYQGWDTLTNYEIPIVVVFHPEQIELFGRDE